METYPYALVGNCTSAALINKDCSVDWLCLPFFDSPSLFARILDENKGGFFRISVCGLVSTQQEYLYHTPILKTTFETEDGVFEVRDYMPRFTTNTSDMYCPSEIHRNIRLVSGRPQIKVELLLRPNYGLSAVSFIKKRGYLKLTSMEGEYNSFYLYSNLDLDAVRSGEPIVLRESSYFLLSYHEKLEEITAEKIYVEYEKTKSHWLDWVFRTKVPQRYRDEAIRSIITLKLLMFERTGAVIAAPTTSLPEIIGGQRNWDYRYCWVRDASMIVDLYSRMGHEYTSGRFINFILNRILLKHENIGVIYGINGEEMLEETELAHLDGFAGSKPVRIGNGAYRQKQNDIYGELIEMIYTSFVVSPRAIRPIDEEIWTAVRSLANHVTRSWRDADCGIWERRDKQAHYVHSKVMNWVAMDRAAKIAAFIGKDSYCPKFQKIAEEIRQDILSNGWNDSIGAFVMSYGSSELDAANLLMLHYGFLPPDDQRIRKTVQKTGEILNRDGFILRYSGDDGFGLPENAFIVCTLWMVNALYLIGEKQRARAGFEKVIACMNPFGLLSEDIETKTGRLTGNFPQGYSHLALVQSIFLLETGYNWNSGDKIF